ncbi:hypothetical protein [Neobacillus muris]|uniref:hypothetical protein n=1 Tax=Neobacillus muris TaxID=2941334 RepID=UPI00203DB472|nr:hypothetical protein [Neobacillus muris]
MIIGAIAVCIPIVAIVTAHFQSQAKIKAAMLKDQLELERIKQQNFIMETEKMRLELQKMTLDQPKDEFKL